MPRFKCIIEYDGTGFSGWQRQDDVPSVQQTLEDAVESFSSKQVRLHTAGRTDAGVHATGQVAHFDLDTDLDAFKIQGAINHFTRDKFVSVLNIEEVDEEFHARFSAKKRHYMYRIINRRPPLVIDAKRAYHVPVPLDVDVMRQGAEYMVGKHDFTSLRDSECQAKSPVKTLDEVRIEQDGENIYLYVSATSFLHHMVRNIVGTLVRVGKGKWPPEKVQEILEAKDRSAAGPTAPAHGLYLTKVDY